MTSTDIAAPGFSISSTSEHTTLANGGPAGFGGAFSRQSASATWTSADGWDEVRRHPLGDLVLSPAAMVLHYGQAIFEGLKAFRSENGTISIFRPASNARRFRDSAVRMAMPELPESMFLDAVAGVVRENADDVPRKGEGSLYLRPFMIATEPRLGTRPSREYLFTVLASPAGDYFATGDQGIRVRLSGDTARAFPGGTGAAKCAGNYAGSMLTYARAAAEGFDQVVWLDALEHRYVEELGGMNVFLVRRGEDGVELVTPPVTDTLLSGITRDTLLTLGADLGLRVRETPIDHHWWRTEAQSGRVTEAFACGTAAGITAIGHVTSDDHDWSMSDGSMGPVTRELRELLVAVQSGDAPGRPGWLHPV
jgi:branched-chain amino acid aminotransferase